MAEQARANESEQRRVAELAKEQANLKTAEARRNLYAADIATVRPRREPRRRPALLNAHLPQPGEPDLRGWEWRYFFGLAQGDGFRWLGQFFIGIHGGQLGSRSIRLRNARLIS